MSAILCRTTHSRFQFAASAYRLPLLPSLAESALGFQSGRTNYAVTVAFSDNVSERKSEIFLSKISPYVVTMFM